ncbi:uncharacterized protein tnxba [Garra rufa]|uniref:uncharacterized protein tnxba n=1 Tax=Garra rufa TaxID=137080 RepID=UPI003CCEAB10
MKDHTKSTSSATSKVNQTLPSSTKLDVDTIQKPVQSIQNTLSDKKNSTTKSVNTINANVEKPTITLLKTKVKDQTQSTSRVNKTLPSSTKPDVDTIQKPVQSVQNTLSEKKNSTSKSINTINVNVEKPTTALLKTKMKDQTQSTSSAATKVNQTLLSSTKPDVDTIQKPVQSVQNTNSEKKNSTTKSTVNTEKPVTTLLKNKIKDQTQPTFSVTTKVNQTLPSSTNPDVDTVQKPVQSVQNTLSEKKNSTSKSINTINVNVEKPTTTLLKTKMKDQTQSTSSTTSRVNQTLPLSVKPKVDTIQKPVQSVQNAVSEKKNSSKSVNTITLKVEKPLTTLKSKLKNQTQSTFPSSKTLLSSLKPVVDTIQRPVSSLPATGEKKNTSTKSIGHTIHVNALKPVNTKMINQTYSGSSKPSRINQTLSSTPKPAVDVQKSGPSFQGTLNEKKNSTSKSTTQTISHNVPKQTTLVNTKTKNRTHATSSQIIVNQTLLSTTKPVVDVTTLSKKKNATVKSTPQTVNVNDSKPVTTSINTKMKIKTQSTTSEISNVNQTVASTAKPIVDKVQNPTKDKPAESSPVKVFITEGCVPQDAQTDVGNVTKVRETELSLNPGSPLVMTHHINLVQGACTGGCETEMAALRDKVEFLEKEMAAIKKICVQCSEEQCPKNCSGQGKCEEGRCVCFQGFSGPDCSGKTCPSNCNKKGKCVKAKCVCQTGYAGLDCSKAVDKKITVTVETVTMKMPTAKPDTKPVKSKPDKTIFVKRLDTTDPKKNTTAKPTVKPSPTVSPDKVQSNTTKRDKIIKTTGQVLLRHEGRRRQEQAKKGKTTTIKLDFEQTQTDLTDKSKKSNLKDEPVYQNVTQRPVKKVNGTSKVLVNVSKGTKESSNASKTKVTIRNTGEQLKESKTVNVTSTSEKDKKLLHSNVTTTLQAEKSDKHANGTSFESKTHSKHFNKTINRLSVLGSVEVHNITSTGFIMSWEAPQGMFKNFTITRKEIRGNEDSEKIQDTTAAENVTDVQRPGLNRTSTKVQSSKPDGRTVKKFSQVLVGTARSYHFKGLQPQTRYSVSLFGSGLEVRSKIHHLTLFTGPEPPTDLMLRNITETSFSVSWTKPKSTVAEFKVTYTNTATGESGSMSVDSQLSHVLLSKLYAGSTYDITVSSVLETLQSEPITASVTTVPDSPTELKVVNITDTKALLVWKPSQAKVDSYILSYGTTKSPNVTITVTLSGSTVEHQLRGLHRSSLYMVKITSQVNRLQSSPVSITFTTGSGVKLQVVTPDEVTFHSSVISWRAPRVAFKSYRLTYQLSEEVKEVILNPSVTRYELTGLAAFSNYTVKIEGERDGQYISFVSADFTTAQLSHPYPTDCSEVQINGKKESGEAEIYPEGKDGEPVVVYCDMETDGGGWTVFQRRMDGSTDFFRSWRDYSRGFGLLSGEFWLGNDILHTLTSRTPMSLWVDLRSGNDTAFAHYANFNVSSEANHYAIELSGYFGTAGDSMKYHNGRPFSTKDKDPNILSIHCAKAYMGGWWYKNCYKANLNGLYGSCSDNKGVVWIDWKGKDASLPFTEMKLRPSYISQTIATTPTTQG